MKKLANSKEMYVCLQLLVLVCLADVWCAVGAEMFRNAVLFFAVGGLFLVLGIVCFFRTARTPYAEEYANVLNLVFHGGAAVFLARGAVLCMGLYHSFLPDIPGVLRMFRYDVDDGWMYAVVSFGFPAGIIGFTACILLVCMGITARREIAAAEREESSRR